MPSPIRTHEAFVKRGPDIFILDPRSITVEEGFNPRTVWHPGDHEDIKNSIRAYGVLEPLRVRHDKGALLLRSGERRLRAVMDLIADGEDIAGVPVILEGLVKEDDTLVRATIYNQHVGLTPMEEAHIVQRLINYGHPLEAIAKKLGRSLGTVRNRLALLEVSPDIQEQLAAGDIKVSAAVKTARKASQNRKKRDNVVDAIIDTSDEGYKTTDVSDGKNSHGSPTDTMVIHRLIDTHGLAWVLQACVAASTLEMVRDTLEDMTETVAR